MKVRTCPHCEHKTSFLNHFKNTLFRLLDSSWSCTNCNSELTVKLKRRIIIVFVSVLPMSLSFPLVGLMGDWGISSGMSWFLFFLFVLVWFVFSYSFDIYSLKENSNKLKYSKGK